ncbi:acetylxylan esterase [Glycomyces tenuis]|uniref:acetylxylan esterase n=1 Tax=Glycomyces tenuis TaxID=58116 RepID=UPI0004200E32|nr:acetylxylan esterase [Glycomyces tenuis]
MTPLPAPYGEWFGPDAFDATYGYDPAALRAVGAPEEPPGFAEFWEDLYARAAAVDPDPRVKPAGRLDGLDLFDIEFTSLGGVRLGGWLTLPERGVDRAVVIGHGYGGRSEPEPELVPDRCAAIFPVLRGLPERSAMDPIPLRGVHHVLHGIESRATYVHGLCAADVWCAASALRAVLPDASLPLGYVGGSFGGGIGALALPWDGRFAAGVLAVPSFGNHDLRLTMPCTGSGESVRLHVAEHPEAREVLRFFDAAVAARRIRIPMLAAPALWDPAVPPPGQFAVANALAGPTEFVVRSAGHSRYPREAEDRERYVAEVRRFLARRLRATA